ncbi:zinc finger protein 64 homolog, isoforms 1 and 2-like [Carassius auratus]|uniref:Zinc finger protein 64 homolog, isoforms 1 and 2-like n=1 Tax=Carassius auratus TaxID=7957 RepID=A0A6P6J7V8_CARAU|nr:zinc finger protein 64 homolog, isoforms 1 and 2-like [Carassius auratus]
MVTLHKGERPFDCELCHMPQLQPADRSPPISHRFQCNQCDAKFKINSDLERHCPVHYDEKPYKCELYKYRCAMKTNLKSHVQLKHSIFDSFHCSKCDLQCSTKAALQQYSHEHQPTQPLQCSGCSYSAPPRGRSRSTAL